MQPVAAVQETSALARADGTEHAGSHARDDDCFANPLWDAPTRTNTAAVRRSGRGAAQGHTKARLNSNVVGEIAHVHYGAADRALHVKRLGSVRGRRTV